MRTAQATTTKFQVACPQCGRLIRGWGYRYDWDIDYLREQNGKAKCCDETFRISHKIMLIKDE